MILSIIALVVLAISLVAYVITKSIFDGIRGEVKKSLTAIPASIDADLDILRALRIID